MEKSPAVKRGKGRKRKAEESFQREFSQKEEAILAPKRAKYTKRAGTNGGNSPGETSNPCVENTSSALRGKKRKAEDAFQKGMEFSEQQGSITAPKCAKRTKRAGNESNNLEISNLGVKSTSPGNSNEENNPSNEKTSNPGASNGGNNPCKRDTSNPCEENTSSAGTSKGGDNPKETSNPGEENTSSAGTSNQVNNLYKIKEATPGLYTFFYEVGNLLGVGGIGYVYKGIRKSDGKEVAIKVIPKRPQRYLTIPGHDKPLFREVALNLLLSTPPVSPHVLQMYEWFEDPNQYVLILEYPQPCETLCDFFKRNGDQLSEGVVRKLMRQVVQGGLYCIERGVMHNDIHPGNILVNTETLQLKLIDFGCGVLICSSEEETARYECKVSKELAVGDTVWALGSVFWMFDESNKFSKDCVNSSKINKELICKTGETQPEVDLVDFHLLKELT